MSDRELIQRLAHVVGDGGLVLDPAGKDTYTRDWLGEWQGSTPVVVLPRNATEVSAVMRLCHQSGTPVVPQGGNTSLSGGATPDGSGEQVILNLCRMNRVRKVDTINNTVTVDAGVPLAEVRAVAARAGRCFPLSLGVEDRCTIGGNLATNAGGAGALRYGNMRDLTLGLEVVLPDGRVWNGLRGLRAGSSGYDLKSLFIGSEGTLGVITGAVLKLHPQPAGRLAAWVGAESLDQVVALLGRLQSCCGDRLAAFEMMSSACVDLVLRHVQGTASPLRGQHSFHVLVELADVRGASLDGLLRDLLEQARGDGLIDDSVAAAGEEACQALWRVRDGISAAQVRAGRVVKHDVALPVSRLAAFVEEADLALTSDFPGLAVVNFGHVGHGNLHYNVLLPAGSGVAEQARLAGALNRRVHDLVLQFGGGISAEHGVGQVRRDALRRYKSPVEMELMLTVKRALDPNQLMNPGKLL